MTTQFKFTPAQRAAFRADPPGYAVGGADRVLTDIERAINQAGVGPVEAFAFSDEDRAAVRAVFANKDVVSTSDTWEALTNAVEAAISRARAGDAVGTIRRSPDGYVTDDDQPVPGAHVFAIKTEKGWYWLHTTGHCMSWLVNPARHQLCAEDIPSWPVVYRPEADS